MATSNAPNAPANLGEIIVFRENQFDLAVTLPAGYAITPPVTAELWFSDVKQTDQVVPVLVVGQRISLILTVPQLRVLKKAKLYLLFNGVYKFVAPLTATMGGAIPTTKEITVSIANIGEVLVTTYNDPATVGVMQELLRNARIESGKAQVAEAKAYEHMVQSGLNATGAVNPAGTYNPITGQMFRAATTGDAGGVFTPTSASTRPKGEVYTLTMPGTSTLTGSSISVATGGSMRSNGVGFAWTYTPPADTGFEISSELASRMPVRNELDMSSFVMGKGMTSVGSEFTNAGYAYFVAELIPGEDYTGHGPSPTKLMRYGCIKDGSNVVVPGSGWNTTPVSTFTNPATGRFGFFTIFIEEVSSFQFELGSVQNDFLPPGARVGKEVFLPAGNVLLDEDHQFATQSQLDALEISQELTEKFVRINYANPEDFVVGEVMTSTGSVVPAPSFSHTGLVDLVPGTQMFFNTDADTGSRYAAFRDASGVIVPSTGWNGVDTKFFTVPALAVFGDFTYPTANAGSVRLGVGLVDTGYIPHDQLYTDEVSFGADAVITNPSKQFVTAAEKGTISTFASVDSTFQRLEWRGLLPKKYTCPSPIYDDLKVWIEYFLQGDDDILIEEDNGSISTGVAGYCSPTANSNLLPEFCREENMWTKWVRYMLNRYFIGQRHFRFDTAGVFTIGGDNTVVATNNDVHWGHQYPNTSTGEDFGGPNPSGQIFFDRYNQIITPNTGNASITFSMSDSYYKMAWLLSYSHKTGTLTFSVAGGSNRLEYFRTSDETWQELHGATLDTSTPDAFDSVIFGTSTKIRRDQHSMPFKMRRKEGESISGAIAVTATMGGGKRIEHWGIYQTRGRSLFIPVCSAKGSHDLVSLRAFYPYGMDKRKPSLYLMSCPTINEWRVASVTPTDTPTQYAARFTGHITTMLAKPYIKGIYARIRGFHQNLNMYSLADMPVYYKTADGYNCGFDYINRAVKEMNIQRIANPGKLAVVNLLPAYVNYNNLLAQQNGLTRHQAIWQNNGSNPPLAISITMDGTHEPDAATENGHRAEINNWNY